MAVSGWGIKDPRWERVAAATGVVFAILAFVAFIIEPNPASPGDSSEEILSFFTENDTTVFWQGLLFGAAGVFFAWFMGTLAAAIRRAEGDPAGRIPAILVIGTAVGLSLYFGGVLAWVSAAAGTDEGLEAGAARALFEVGVAAFTFADFAAIVILLAASLGILRTGLVPAWLGWIGLLAVVAFIIDVISRIFADDGFFSSDPGTFTWGTIAFLAFLAWILLVSALLTQRVRAARAVTPTPTPA